MPFIPVRLAECVIIVAERSYRMGSNVPVDEPTDLTRGAIERLLREVPLFRVVVRAAECRLFPDLDLPSPVLDVGCGDGTFAYALDPKAGWIGIEPARKPASAAFRLGAYSLVALAEGAQMPFPDASFGAAISNSTLEHIPDVDAVLREMDRVLKPGGVLAVTFPSDQFYDYYFGTILFSRLHLAPLERAYRRWVRYTARVRHADSPDVWRRRFDILGFHVESWRYYFSRRNTAVMDITHYTSAPSLITHVLLRRWIMWPGKVRLLPIARWIRTLTEPGPADEGSFLLFVCRKPAIG